MVRNLKYAHGPRLGLVSLDSLTPCLTVSQPARMFESCLNLPNLNNGDLIIWNQYLHTAAGSLIAS